MVATLRNNDLEIIKKILEAFGQMDNFQKGYFLGRAEEMVAKEEKKKKE